MNKRKLIQHHKWLGLVLSFFLLMFCVSGILLNHRQLI
ncbi:MAG: peptidase, partial [Prevotella sp.]|nr:peptidase [Prevotella sp.]